MSDDCAGDKADEAIASALLCTGDEAIEIPISLWSKEEIDELYEKLPDTLRINPEGRMPGCARIERRAPSQGKGTDR